MAVLVLDRQDHDGDDHDGGRCDHDPTTALRAAARLLVVVHQPALHRVRGRDERHVQRAACAGAVVAGVAQAPLALDRVVGGDAVVHLESAAGPRSSNRADTNFRTWSQLAGHALLRL